MATDPTIPDSFEQRFDADGLDLVPSVDAGRPPRYPLLVNLRQTRRGEFRSRPALSAYSTAPAAKTPWHSVRRLNDKPSGNYTHVSGIGTELFTTPAAAAASAPGNPISRDSGYSGNPLSLVPFRPVDDIATWMAVGDTAKMRKVRLDGTVHQLGLPQPTRPPDVGLDWLWGIQRSDIETGENAAGWNVSAPGGIAAVNVNRHTAACTVVRTLWGDGLDPTGGFSSGWTSIEVGTGPPNGLTNIGPGTVLKDAINHYLTVEEIHPPSPAATTVSQVLFDDGGSGPGYCVFVPAAAYREFAQHAIVRFVGGVTSYAVITAVIRGPDNTIAVRAYCQGSPAPGDAVDVRSTIYAYCPFFPTGNLTSNGVKYAGLNTVSTVYSLPSLTVNLNLSSFPSGKQIDVSQDEMHVSLNCSDWTLVDSIKVQLDLDDGTFTKNFVSRTIRQADLLALQTNAVGPVDTRATEIRNKLLDHPGATGPRAGHPLVRDPGQGGDPVYSDNPHPSGPTPDAPGGSSSQGATGNNQWSEIRFKLSDLLSNRFGADISKGLQKVVQLQMVVTRNATAGVCDVALGSWWIGGGSPPDVGQGAPYEYRYRYRCSITGARSNWSPPGRSLAWPHRYSVYVQTYTQNALGNPAIPAEVDKVDIQRRGGTVNEWVTVGTVDASFNPYWTDLYDDIYALGAAEDPLALEGNTNDQPMTVQQPAFTDTASTVSGTLIRHTNAFAAFFSGGVSKLNQGVGVRVNGVSTLVYRLLSADLLEVYDNVGSGTNLKIEIPSPEIVGQPIPVIFGDIDGWWFACGDPKNPGRLYAFNRGTLDSAPAAFRTDITDPSDPLQNGCAYQGRGYLWSANAMFVLSIDPSLPDSPIRFERLAQSVGMFARYALACGDEMYWLGKDGVYASEGGTARNLTTGTLAPLFPAKQIPGADTNSIPAPALTVANAAADGNALHQFRLSYLHDRTLWLDYVDGTGARRSLGLQRAAGTGTLLAVGAQEQWGWWYDTYANGALFHYSEEGENVQRILCGGTSTTSKLYTLLPSSNGDDGTPYTCQLRTYAFDADSPRPRKLWTDFYLDADASTASLAVKLYTDNWSANLTPAASPLSGAGRSKRLLDINSGRGVYALNTAIDVVWTVGAAEAPILYAWGGSVFLRPDDTQQRSTDYTDCGWWGPKEFRGADVECSASAYDASGIAIPVSKTLVFEYTRDDGSVATVPIAITAAEKSIVPVAFPSTVIGYEIRIRPSDTNTWKEYAVKQWHFDALTDLTPLISQWDSLERLSYVQGLELFADTNGAPVSVTVQRDFAAVAATFSATHPGRGWKSYSFANPFLAYLLRLVPAGAIRLMKWRWITQPEAPLGDVWEAQEVELGDPFGFAQYAEIEYASSSALTFKYTIDGTLVYTDSATLASTGGVDPGAFRKVRVILPAAKGRLAKLRIESSAQFRIREKGTGLYRKSYGGMEGFRFAPLLGAPHHEAGAYV